MLNRYSLFAVVSLTSLAMAQEPAGGTPEKVVSGSLGIDFTTQYFFRGILQEDQGFIAEPWIELGYNLYSGDGEFKNLDLTFGQWNSLHTGPTGSGGGSTMWYESDFYAGLSAQLGERASLGATYTAYHSPNGRFGTVQELAFSFGYDDNALLSESFSGLQPSAVVAFEVDGQADAGAKKGIYGQLGVEPSFAAGKLGDLDVTVSVPVTLGVSLSDYYEYGTGDDDFFGFFDIGVAASSPLPFLPARLGPWDAKLALHALFLGSNNETVNGGDSTELILSFGLSTSF